MGLDEGFGQIQQVVVGGVEQARREPLPGLAEGLVADGPNADGRALQLREQAIELGLGTGLHAADHHRGQARQGEQAMARESSGMQPDLIGQRGIGEELTEAGQDAVRSRYLSSYC
jgi:hypothetical protein